MAIKFLSGIDVEGSLNIAAADIPNLSASVITHGTLNAARIPVLPYAASSSFTIPSTPTIVSVATNGDGIQVSFNSSLNSQYYEIWSSINNQDDFGLVGKIDPLSVSSVMTFLDATVNSNSATVYYRVYGINKGIYSQALSFSHVFSWTAPDIVPTSTSSMDLLFISWEPVTSRLVSGYQIKHHSGIGSTSYASSAIIASTSNTTYIHTIGGEALSYNHEFWIEALY